MSEKGRFENVITSEDREFELSEIIDETAVNEPMLGEVKEAIRRLKNGKVTGIVMRLLH